MQLHNEFNDVSDELSNEKSALTLVSLKRISNCANKLRLHATTLY